MQGCGKGEGRFGWPVGLHQLAWGLTTTTGMLREPCSIKKSLKVHWEGPPHSLFHFPLLDGRDVKAQENLSTKALQVRDVGAFQLCPTDLHPPETPFYKSAALQPGGERRALSSARAKASFVCVHTYTLPVSPSCCHGAGISRRGTSRWVRAAPCCPLPLL